MNQLYSDSSRTDNNLSNLTTTFYMLSKPDAPVYYTEQ